MPVQHYKNHRKVYPPHHLVFYPVVIAAICLCIHWARQHPGAQLEFFCMAFLLFLLAAFSFMTRQHYALGLQDRIVRLEMRLRYFELTGQRFSEVEKQLSFGQMAALRFASDEELLPLIAQTLQEKLSPKEIKLLVKDWQADWMRV
jgi:hypothetical protein